jgi:hypothetical protein
MVERHRDEREPFQTVKGGGLWKQQRKRRSTREGRATMAFAMSE